MPDDIQFQNMDSWRGGSSGKFKLTFKDIIIQHINRCVQNGSVEWHGGYHNETGHNPVTRTYVPNSRSVYSNSVKMLRALMLGYFDEKMKKADKELQEEYKKEYERIEKLQKEQQEKEKDLYETWNNFKVDWHVRLFEQLIMLGKRLNFFEEEATEEEM